jgi:Tfp pilus assembly protein PilX
MKHLKEGKKALQQNRGNGLILVLVIAVVVTFLGIALLSTSYTSYLVKVAERESNDTFASAEDGMDLIRA